VNQQHSWTSTVFSWIVRRPIKTAFDAVSIFSIGQLYLATTASGLRRINTTILGQKMYRQPFCGWMENFEFTYRFDLADLTTFILFVVCFGTVQVGIRSHMYRDHFADHSTATNTTFVQKIFRLGGITVLLLDTILCFTGLLHNGVWGGNNVFSALVFSALYLTLLIMSSAISAYLARNRRIL